MSDPDPSDAPVRREKKKTKDDSIAQLLHRQSQRGWRVQTKLARVWPLRRRARSIVPARRDWRSARRIPIILHVPNERGRTCARRVRGAPPNSPVTTESVNSVSRKCRAAVVSVRRGESHAAERRNVHEVCDVILCTRSKMRGREIDIARLVAQITQSQGCVRRAVRMTGVARQSQGARFLTQYCGREVKQEISEQQIGGDAGALRIVAGPDHARASASSARGSGSAK